MKKVFIIVMLVLASVSTTIAENKTSLMAKNFITVKESMTVSLSMAEQDSTTNGM